MLVRQGCGELHKRRRRQNLRWLWTTVEDRLRRAVYAHPAVRAIRKEVEQEVLTGALPAEAAARRILEAFELEGGGG